MRTLILLFFIIPFTVFSQGNYNAKAKKTYQTAINALNDNNLTQAETLLKECLTIEPNYIEAYYNLAIIAYLNNDFKRSIDYGKNALNISKTKAPIYSQIAKSYFKLNNFDSSAYYSNVATILNPNSPEDFYLLAKSENNIKKYEKALKHINKSININPKNSDYYLVRGNAYFGLNDLENAKNNYLKVLDLDPSNKSIYKNLANVYIAEGDNEKAIDAINKGINDAKGNDKISYLILKGNYYHNIGDLENAKKAFEEAYMLDQESPIILNNLAAILIDKGDFEDAVEKATLAIDIDPTLSEAYFNRGIANEMLRNTTDACSDWEEAFILGAVKAEDYLNSPTCNE